MSDLIKTLRAAESIPHDFSFAKFAKLCGEAADEIEYLRSLTGPVKRPTDLHAQARAK